jgi:putative transposase
MTHLLQQQLANSAPLAQLCQTLGLPRSTFYRQTHTSVEVDQEEMTLRDTIQRLALTMPFYGYRRITAHLHRQGLKVNHKRVLRLMRQDNLLCLRQRKAFLVTTDSNHRFAIYPNLAAEMLLTDINQLWVADLTYIRLRREFIYLAAILDAYSRRCIGWELSHKIDAQLAIQALQMALANREVVPGLVHHSDRGVQYASREYTAILHQHQVQISMSRKGNPYDNAQAERFMRTLKEEEVYLSDYENLSEARSSLKRFLEEVYNQKRLHSALGYVPPAEFEQSLYQRTYP